MMRFSISLLVVLISVSLCAQPVRGHPLYVFMMINIGCLSVLLMRGC